jgi:uncharacterized protein YukE
MLGMDTDQILQHSEMERAEGTLRSRLDAVDRTVSGIGAFWRGADAEEFRTAWNTVRHDVAEALLERLRNAARELAAVTSSCGARSSRISRSSACLGTCRTSAPPESLGRTAWGPDGMLYAVTRWG